MVPQVKTLDDRRLSQAAGVDLEPHAGELLEWLNRYLSWNSELRTAPNARDVVSCLRKIRQHSRKLADLLANPVIASQCAFAACFQERQDTSEELSRSLDSLSDSADARLREWQKKVETKRGAPWKPGMILRPLIWAVDSIYEQAGGTRERLSLGSDGRCLLWAAAGAQLPASCRGREGRRAEIFKKHCSPVDH